MTAATLVSTNDFAPRDRAPVWRDWIWKHFGGLESDLYGDTDFDGEMVSAQAGDVVLTRLEANLRMTPTERLERHAEALAFVEEIRRSRARRLQDPPARPGR